MALGVETRVVSTIIPEPESEEQQADERAKGDGASGKIEHGQHGSADERASKPNRRAEALTPKNAPQENPAAR